MGRTRIALCAVAAVLVCGSTGVAQAKTMSPTAGITCLAQHPGAIRFCTAREHRVALRIVRRKQTHELKRTHTTHFPRGWYHGWNIRRLKAANHWERSRLKHLLTLPTWQQVHLVPQWTCIHNHEGAWNDSGDPYWGGLQMDRSFMSSYGSDMIRKYGGYANVWSPRDQMIVAERAYYSGRGFGPWPNTRRMCGI